MRARRSGRRASTETPGVRMGEPARERRVLAVRPVGMSRSRGTVKDLGCHSG